MTLWLLLSAAFAAPPATLDDLVALAVGRDPEVQALGHDADAARSRADAAGRPMPPELMVAADALGAPKDALDPTMVMVGASQMLRGYGEARAWRDRLALDAARSAADRDRVEADLRARLWQLAAEIDAGQSELALVDEQIRSATALEQIGFARYGAGAGGAMPAGGAMGGMPGGMSGSMPTMPGSSPPVVAPGPGASGGMPGMGAMGGGGSSTVPVPAGPSAMTAGNATPPAMGGGGEGLSALLRLDADLARLDGERAGVAAELAGRLEVLRAFAGDEAVDAVRARPAGFLGDPTGTAAPERALAEVDRDAAAAAIDVAVAQRRPDLMVSVAERFMPEELGMPAGTDVSLGIQLPLWGSQARTIDAARAAAAAADARVDRVERDLAVARASTSGAWQAAQARSAALDGTAVPRARQAWEASQALYAAGRASADDAVRAWETWIQVEREAVQARRDVQVSAADLARLGGE